MRYIVMMTIAIAIHVRPFNPYGATRHWLPLPTNEPQFYLYLPHDMLFRLDELIYTIESKPFAIIFISRQLYTATRAGELCH